MNRKDAVRAALASVLGATAFDGAKAPTREDAGDWPRLPDGKYVVSVTSPLRRDDFGPDCPGIVFVLPDEWEALVLSRGLRRLGELG